MQTLIPDVVAFPTDAQSDLFFCALTSALQAIEGAREDGDLFCGRRKAPCVACLDCGDKDGVQRRHLQLYHHYVTVTGVALRWRDDPLPVDTLDFAMRAAGCAYEEIGAESGKQPIFARLSQSVDRGLPALMKLGQGRDWCVVTGYDSETQALYGLDAGKHYAAQPTVAPEGYSDDGLFVHPNWYEHLSTAVMITGRHEAPIPPEDMLARMVGVLAAHERSGFETHVVQLIDDADETGAQGAASELNRYAGYAAENRWHAAECLAATLYCLASSAADKQRMAGTADRFLNSHDLCWEVWSALGVGPGTNYGVPDNAGALLLAQRDEVKRLFQMLCENDRAVLDLLSRIATADYGIHLVPDSREGKHA